MTYKIVRKIRNKIIKFSLFLASKNRASCKKLEISNVQQLFDIFIYLSEHKTFYLTLRFNQLFSVHLKLVLAKDFQNFQTL